MTVLAPVQYLHRLVVLILDVAVFYEFVFFALLIFLHFTTILNKKINY